VLRCSTSLWSADLANLAHEIRRVEPFSERFHLDVADGHYVPNLLFFPDLVRSLRAHTRRPFEVHLMTTDPLRWVEPFRAAGADGFIFCFDTLPDPRAALAAAREVGAFAGISLSLGEGVERLDPWLHELDQVTLLGTALGIKGASMDASLPGKVRRLRARLRTTGARAEVQVDGGIRRTTVPELLAAGADWIVPGSLMFAEDAGATRAWLDGLGPSSPPE
jgi:ribulose-phosphate 3-epimerase